MPRPWHYSDVSDSSDLVIDAAGIVVRRGPATLLAGVDWQVELDERWVILGPNGAGKTTLLKLAAGRLHPSAGVMRVLDERLGRVDVFELRPRIGLSTAALAEEIPADEKVIDVVRTAAWGLVGSWHERYDDIDDARARDLLARFGVDGLAERTYRTLSEGERKRVQIARALMTDPELLLLDEPAAGLDLGAREILVGMLAELAADADAPALVMVTHHVEEIPPGFTHAMVMSGGGVVAAGLIDDVLTSDNLSRAFGIPLILERRGDRFTARAA
ncbi:ABC transporter ATP-binding protein [Stackebrandtia soli]|uniref:ABC transporter ATP-binding protein n=1 Tax=Stackebrandtia soli TaxID=1892856 RepID=UPI0039ECA054